MSLSVIMIKSAARQSYFMKHLLFEITCIWWWKKANHNILRNCYIFKTIFSQFHWSSQSSLSNTNKIKLSVSFDTPAQTLRLGQTWLFQICSDCLKITHLKYTSQAYVSTVKKQKPLRAGGGAINKPKQLKNLNVGWMNIHNNEPSRKMRSFGDIML